MAGVVGRAVAREMEPRRAMAEVFIVVLLCLER